MAMEQTKIHAGFVHTEHDGKVVSIGFADQECDTKAYVLLQRALCPSADDIRRRWDDVHIEINDEIRSAYGGVKRIDIGDKRVLIELTPTTAGHLGTAETISIEITDSLVPMSELAKMLRLVCGIHASFTG